MTGDERHGEDQRILIGGVELELPERGTGARAARRAKLAEPADPATPLPLDRPPPRRPGPSRRWMAAYGAALCVAVLAAGALVVVGASTLRDSTAGRRVSSAAPDEPGFEALLEPTPTMLVLHTSGGRLHAASLLSLTNQEHGGGVLVVPASVEVTSDVGTLAAAHMADGAGVDELRVLVEVVTSVGIQEVVEVDDARLAGLVAPVSPLRVVSPVAVGDHPAGAIDLAADEVGPWLSGRADEETEEAASYRVTIVWEAWLSAVRTADDPAALVPGELDVGISRFIAGLARGDVRSTTLPVDESPGEGPTVLRVDREALDGLITDLVPYPTGGLFVARTLVRVLDGTGDQQLVPRTLPVVVGSEASVVVVGNADAFDYDTTEIRYHQPAQQVAAERLREALGVGEVIEDVRPIDAFDVTIVLGADI